MLIDASITRWHFIGVGHARARINGLNLGTPRHRTIRKRTGVVAGAAEADLPGRQPSKAARLSLLVDYIQTSRLMPQVLPLNSSLPCELLPNVCPARMSHACEEDGRV